MRKNQFQEMKVEESWEKTKRVTFKAKEQYLRTEVDRIKDILEFRSWYLARAKIESILLSHPTVDALFVVEHPVAVVVSRCHAVATVAGEDIKNYANRCKTRGGVNIVAFNCSLFLQSCVLESDIDWKEDKEFIVKGREPNYIPEPKGMGYAYYMYMKRHKHAVAQVNF
ncbi:hypothetical protein ILUMI_20151 [Ignelater luminosus]|uniref:Uncharacterized protein n=1 Tax=Ignelater luminosus TaxID=2038154 RepID=A0A8K0G4W2_IGNLU|nr:hypothetical protein ILUMI_20151 [Ignelater luminosus]